MYLDKNKYWNKLIRCQSVMDLSWIDWNRLIIFLILMCTYLSVRANDFALSSVRYSMSHNLNHATTLNLARFSVGCTLCRWVGNRDHAVWLTMSEPMSSQGRDSKSCGRSFWMVKIAADLASLALADEFFNIVIYKGQVQAGPCTWKNKEYLRR